MEGIVCSSGVHPAPTIPSDAAFVIWPSKAETFLNANIHKFKHLMALGCYSIIPDIIVGPTGQDNGPRVEAGAECLTLFVEGLTKIVLDEGRKLAGWCGFPVNIQLASRMPNWESMKAATSVGTAEGEVDSTAGVQPSNSSHEPSLNNTTQQSDSTTAEAAATGPQARTTAEKRSGTSARPRFRHAQSMLSTKTGNMQDRSRARSPCSISRCVFSTSLMS
jgi:hypothetical protein